MNKYESAIKALSDGIQRYVDNAVENVKADKTYTALVTGIYSADDNTYNIKLNGVDYQNVPTLGGVCFMNESVKVTYPYGNSNNMYINKYELINSGNSAVSSVNGKTGAVVLTSIDVGALSYSDAQMYTNQAHTSEINATNSASAATTSASNAHTSETNAATSASTAATKATQASTSATNAANSATASSNSASASSASATSALAYDTEAKSYAVGGTGTRTGEDTNNAKYYAAQARIVSGTDAWIDFDANGYLTLYTKED